MPILNVSPNVGKNCLDNFFMFVTFWEGIILEVSLNFLKSKQLSYQDVPKSCLNLKDLEWFENSLWNYVSPEIAVTINCLTDW